jgi:ABC-2 type transport system permease protein
MLIFKIVAGDTTLASGMSYVDFVVPGLVAMSLLQMTIFSIAFVVAQYKEKGVLKRLFATPMRPMDFLSAQVITRLLLGLIQVLLLISVAILALNYYMLGGFLAIILVSILGILVFLSLGFVVSGLAKSVETVPAIANMILFPMIFFGNIFFPLDNLPGWLRPVADILPVKYLADALRSVMTEGASILEVRGDLLGMAVWLMVLLFVAQKVFSFSSKS